MVEVVDAFQDKRLFRSYAGGVVGGILPLSLFAGSLHFVSRMAWRANNAAPYSVHWKRSSMAGRPVSAIGCASTLARQ